MKSRVNTMNYQPNRIEREGEDVGRVFTCEDLPEAIQALFFNKQAKGPVVGNEILMQASSSEMKEFEAFLNNPTWWERRKWRNKTFAFRFQVAVELINAENQLYRVRCIGVSAETLMRTKLLAMMGRQKARILNCLQALQQNFAPYHTEAKRIVAEREASSSDASTLRIG